MIRPPAIQQGRLTPTRFANRAIRNVTLLTFVTNSNDVVMDESMSEDVNHAMSDVFALDNVYCYAHGWWQTEDAAMTDYNKFSTGYVAHCRTAAFPPGKLLKAGDPQVAFPPGALAVAVHWPSAITEVRSFFTDVFGAASYYVMEKRADDVGETGVYGLLRQMLTAMSARPRPIRVNLIGHSFGTKVVCSALVELVKECRKDNVSLQNIAIRVVLLQPAFAQESLDPGDDYGEILSLPDVRMLLTTSQLDAALGTLFPFAQRARLHFAKGESTALGFGGPTAATQAAYGGVETVTVSRGDQFVGKKGFKEKLVVADLTPLHESDNVVQAGETKRRYSPGKESGNHSDIFNDEVYGLIARFLY